MLGASLNLVHLGLQEYYTRPAQYLYYITISTSISQITHISSITNVTSITHVARILPILPISPLLPVLPVCMGSPAIIQYKKLTNKCKENISWIRDQNSCETGESQKVVKQDRLPIPADILVNINP